MSPKAYTSSSTLSSEMTAPLKPGSLEDPRIQGKQKEATKFSREVLEVHFLEAKRWPPVVIYFIHLVYLWIFRAYFWGLEDTLWLQAWGIDDEAHMAAVKQVQDTSECRFLLFLQIRVT